MFHFKESLSTISHIPLCQNIDKQNVKTSKENIESENAVYL